MTTVRTVAVSGACGVAVLAALSACGAGGSPAARAPSTSATATRSATVALAAAPAPLTKRDRLRVGSSDGQRRLVDADGRPISLRGVNVNALVDYGSDGTAPIPATAADFDQIASLGLNVVRLSVSWSKVMPTPGQLDQDYLRQITTLVQEAGQRHVYTVVSMHSDRYAAGLGTGTEFDGAPAWAVDTGGAACGDPAPRYYTACAAAAAKRFYANAEVSGQPLQDFYADAVVAVAKAGRSGGPGFSGIDIINEPTDPGANPDVDATPVWQHELFGLEHLLVDRLRTYGVREPIWIQPQGPRSTAANAPAVLPPMTDPQLVYAPHAYIDVYGTQPTAATQERLPAQYRAFEAEGKKLHAAVVVGEFPGATGGVWEDLLRLHLAQQRRTGIGGIAWLWKQPASGYGWGTVAPDGSLRPGSQAAQLLSGARLVAGSARVKVVAHSDHGASVSSTGPAQTVDVWLGSRFGAPTDIKLPYAIASATGAKLVAEWSQRATVPGGTTTGTLVRLRLGSGRSSARLVPDAP